MADPDKVTVSITVNEASHTVDVEPRTLLVHLLRNELGLTGTHTGCETGQCGACTVLMDGKAIKSCMVLAVQADGHEVTTVEGIAPQGELHPIQQAFWEHHGLQCGYCTPGMLLSSLALLDEHPDPDDNTIRHGIEGNICRCTGYNSILLSVHDAAQRMQRGDTPQPIASGETEGRS
ncbi:MAG TPA: (2Fe-2S)-binding protein [Thermomicrobiales bacterium]|nr:(2Fe-2S)-binding protein [Thermomicrobiales bacterium]